MKRCWWLYATLYHMRTTQEGAEDCQDWTSRNMVKERIKTSHQSIQENFIILKPIQKALFTGAQPHHSPPSQPDSPYPPQSSSS